VRPQRPRQQAGKDVLSSHACLFISTTGNPESGQLNRALRLLYGTIHTIVDQRMSW
jgi:hypothetical protein